MRLSPLFKQSRTRITIIFLILSMILVACDTLTSPETEETTTFDGAPEVIIASPLNGDTYQEGVGVNILLRVDNAGPDVARIAVEVDGEIIGEAILPNPNGDPSFTVNNGWPAMGEGPHVISAVASRSDGTVSEEASVTINVVADDMAMQEDPTPIPLPTDTSDNADSDSDSDDDSTGEDTTDTKPPTQESASQEQEPQATATTAPSATPAPTNTPSRPQVIVRQGANVRAGPGTVFEPPVGSLAAGTRANILAVNTAGTWYRIEYGLSDAWISNIVVDVEGDLSGLPREAGPPTPIPATPVPPTPEPTPVPETNVDLFIDEAQSSFVPTFRCGRPTTINVTVVNGGTETSPGGTIAIEDVQPNGSVGENTQTVFGELAPNASQTVQAVLTVSAFVNEAHTFRARVDSNNTILETNENNNVWDEVYVLEPC